MVSKSKWRIGILAVSTLVITIIALQYSSSSDWFVEHSLPLKETHRLFDIGVVDANGDNLLDIYTSNHHFRQALLIADKQGGYRDKLSDWGLDQSPEFPLAELSFTKPVIDKPGLYIYWFGTRVVLKTHKTSEIGPWHGSLQIHELIEIIKNDGFDIEKQEKEMTIKKRKRGVTAETILDFSSRTDATLVLNPTGQGLPLNFEISNVNPIAQVYVGRGKISPKSSKFSLSMQDRHALAWSDYNNDGLLDIYISRGALGGALLAYPDEVVQGVKDELLASRAGKPFVDIASEVGIRKNGCSGRHSRWVDFDQDGLLDLFINCYERKNVQGNYPKQLYKQDANGQFDDVATERGIDIPDQQIGSLLWIDADNDGDPDLVALQDDGFFLYRNQAGYFSQELIHRRTSEVVEKIGDTKGDVWFFDGKLTVVDYDRDGDLDLFSASRRGNVLLSNNKGNYVPIEPSSVGLPATSTTANWVDYDNDGLSDLHIVPQGIFRQTKDHVFEPTKLLSFPSKQYTAAICNWFDIDNDGRRDIMLALSVNPSFKHWWEFSPAKRNTSAWLVESYRNVGAENHWLQIKLVGGAKNRQGIGARVMVTTPDGQQVQEVGSTDGAFFSQGHYRLYFGLGSHAKADVVKIRWSDGYQQEVPDVTGDQLFVVKR